MWVYDHGLLNLSAGVFNLRLLFIGWHGILILERWSTRAFERIRGFTSPNPFIAILHGEEELTSLWDTELAGFDRLDTLMKVIPVKLTKRKNHDLFLPLHSGLKMIPNENTWLRGRFKPRTILPLGLGTNPIIDPASKR